MMRRMFRAGSLLVLVLPIVVITWSASASAQTADARVKTLIRQASKECRTAKTLRRSDLATAQEHFRNYQKIFNEALDIKPDLLDSPGKDTERVLNYCDVVKKDLDRAEALPQFERGLRECAEARVMISNAAFDDADEQYRRYREYRDGAVAISESVLEVYGPNSYEVRLCDRLGDDIALARQEYQRQLRESRAESQNFFKDVLAGLNQSERQCRGAQNLIGDAEGYNAQTISQVESLSVQAGQGRKAATDLRDKLLAQGKRLDAKTKDRIDALVSGINECQGSVPSGITRIKAALAARSSKPGTPAKAESVNRDLRQIVGAPATYPRRAIRKDIEGFVTVRFTVTRAGDVADIEIKEAQPEGYFESAVTKAVSKYKFQPRVRNGQPVDTKGVERKVVFKLK